MVVFAVKIGNLRIYTHPSRVFDAGLQVLIVGCSDRIRHFDADARSVEMPKAFGTVQTGGFFSFTDHSSAAVQMVSERAVDEWESVDIRCGLQWVVIWRAACTHLLSRNREYSAASMAG